MILQNALRAGLAVVSLACGCATLAAAPTTRQPPAVPPQYRVDAWPRAIKLSNADAKVYPPQVSKWTDSDIEFRCAVAIKPTGAANEVFGVVFATARTHVDKVTRTVDFDSLTITRSEFPALPDHGASYAAELGKRLATSVRRVSLDRLQLSLAIAGTAAAGVAVRNEPPRVIVSESPAILVPIDGAPVMKPVAGSPGWQRVINTRALILKSAAAPQYFLHVDDGWLMAMALDGNWEQPFLPPTGIDAVAASVAGTGMVDMIDGGPRAKPPPSLAQGIPVIYTSQVPAELIVFAGKPDFAPLVGTGLTWATNTSSDVLRETASGNYFTLLAGRWFRAAALTGPWTFVASDALPADFAKIPPSSRAGAVLAAVAGTQQAREAAIENSIPQTATIPRKNGPQFTAKYDGAPQFAAIPGTMLAYAVNAAVPVIRTETNAYLAVVAGIWFTSPAATGPWSLATSVPASINSIPPSSPVFYVRYVRIYGVTADAVFGGYTPGYLGALRAPSGTIVYGTGYAYPPWIGSVWYPAQSTYGVAAAPVYNRYVGYTYGFAMGLATIAAPSGASGAQFHPLYWGGYPCCGTTSANVYRYWGRAAYAKTRGKKASAGSPKPHAKRQGTVAGAPKPNASSAAVAPPPISAPNPQDISLPNRGYDMTMVTAQDAPNPGRPGAPVPTSPPEYISAVEYYKSMGQTPPTVSASPPSNVYADAQGNVYRRNGTSWQQHSAGNWTNVPAPPPAVDQEMSARDRAAQAAMQAGSYSISNTTRFTGMPGDGWSRRDSGDGGYSRTLGGDGGISAEQWAYNDAVLNNEFDIAMNGGWWGDGVYIGGIGWGGAFGSP